jgi:uncharacterized protein (TIGR00304 family)
MDALTLFDFGLALTLAGTLIIIVAVVLLFLSGTKKEGEVKGGGAILVGPIPIVFGTDKKSLMIVLILAIALTALLIAVMVIFHFLIS